jgi:hypothetical protein
MAELIQYQLGRDANMLPHGDVIYPPKYVNAYVLAAGVATPVTIPTGARIAVFSSNTNFYVNWLTTAAVPSANITDGSAPELNPVARDVSRYSSFSVVSPDACVLTIAYFL